MRAPEVNRDFALLFLVMLTIAAGNTALQSVLPALGRSLKVPDSAVAAAFSVSALLWVVAAPYWANRSDRHGRRAMILLGVGGFCVSLLLCGLFLAAGINGWISGTAAFICFIGGRLIYGTFGAAAPPAVQALVAGRTSREERTRALTLLGSAFGLGTDPRPGHRPVPDPRQHRRRSRSACPVRPSSSRCSPPASMSPCSSAFPMIATPQPGTHGAANAYPSIGGQSSGASITAAIEPHSERVGYFDPRVRAWMIAGLVMGHAQAMTSQAIGFLVIDRLHLAPVDALQPTGIVLMMGAGAALLVQWGIIPLLDMKPRQLMLVGLVIGAVGLRADRDRDLALRHRDGLCAGVDRLRFHPARLHRRLVARGGASPRKARSRAR